MIEGPELRACMGFAGSMTEVELVAGCGVVVAVLVLVLVVLGALGDLLPLENMDITL